MNDLAEHQTEREGKEVHHTPPKNDRFVCSRHGGDPMTPQGCSRTFSAPGGRSYGVDGHTREARAASAQHRPR